MRRARLQRPARPVAEQQHRAQQAGVVQQPVDAARLRGVDGQMLIGAFDGELAAGRLKDALAG